MPETATTRLRPGRSRSSRRPSPGGRGTRRARGQPPGFLRSARNRIAGRSRSPPSRRRASCRCNGRRRGSPRPPRRPPRARPRRDAAFGRSPSEQPVEARSDPAGVEARDLHRGELAAFPCRGKAGVERTPSRACRSFAPRARSPPRRSSFRATRARRRAPGRRRRPRAGSPRRPSPSSPRPGSRTGDGGRPRAFPGGPQRARSEGHAPSPALRMPFRRRPAAPCPGRM